MPCTTKQQAAIMIGSAYLNEAGKPNQAVPIARLCRWVTDGQMKATLAWVEVEAALKRIAADPSVTLSASRKVRRHRADWPGYVVVNGRAYDHIAIRY